jgi:hypothetical protein
MQLQKQPAVAGNLQDQIPMTLMLVTFVHPFVQAFVRQIFAFFTLEKMQVLSQIQTKDKLDS